MTRSGIVERRAALQPGRAATHFRGREGNLRGNMQLLEVTRGTVLDFVRTGA